MQKIECHMLISQTPSPKEKVRETRLSDSVDNFIYFD